MRAEGWCVQRSGGSIPGRLQVLNPLNHAMQVDTDFSNDSDVRAVLIVHDTKPPFLDGRVSFTKQSQAVMPIRDPTSDMAVIARNGSHLVKEVREKKEKNKSRARFWEMAGSKIGQITGLCSFLQASLRLCSAPRQ
jgi:hypothetical protein